jgi:hypothetical protein
VWGSGQGWKHGEALDQGASKDLNETCELIEKGFEYITDMDDTKIFRKPKHSGG